MGVSIYEWSKVIESDQYLSLSSNRSTLWLNRFNVYLILSSLVSCLDVFNFKIVQTLLRHISTSPVFLLGGLESLLLSFLAGNGIVTIGLLLLLLLDRLLRRIIIFIIIIIVVCSFENLVIERVFSVVVEACLKSSFKTLAFCCRRSKACFHQTAR